MFDHLSLYIFLLWHCVNLLSVNADNIIVLLGEYDAIVFLQYDIMSEKYDLKNDENLMKNILDYIVNLFLFSHLEL